MSRTTLALLGALGCGAPEAPPERVIGVAIDAVVEPGERGPVLTVQVSAPSDARWTLPEPDVEGLTAQPAEGRVEQVGARTVTTRRWVLRGAPGSYVVQPTCVAVEGSSDPPPCAPPIYVDVGVKHDRSQMADITEPAPTWPAVPWALLAAGLLGVGGLAAGATLLLRRRAEPALVPVAEEPPDVVAIRRWEAIRDDPTLSDHDKALGLSEVFRVYVEAVLHFPARSSTTTETLAHLERLDALPKANVPRARRLLRATDRVKYAEARPAEGFFRDLEGDLHAFVDQTRPRRWQSEEGR